jgi:hypothetical protein
MHEYHALRSHPHACVQRPRVRRRGSMNDDDPSLFWDGFRVESLAGAHTETADGNSTAAWGRVLPGRRHGLAIAFLLRDDGARLPGGPRRGSPSRAHTLLRTTPCPRARAWQTHARTRPTDLSRVSRTWVAFQFLCNLNLCARRPVLLLHSALFRPFSSRRVAVSTQRGWPITGLLQDWLREISSVSTPYPVQA